MKKLYIHILLITAALSAVNCSRNNENMFWQIDTRQQWLSATDSLSDLLIQESDDLNGVIDLMGTGALLLDKIQNTPFQKTTPFKSSGEWISAWQDAQSTVQLRSFAATVLCYGNPIDMRRNWVKFTGNPVLSGSNTLLPLNRNNITNETLLLPEPGGVPQDQSIVRGTGRWKDKWLLFFNHTPDKWPNEYYWSFAVADSLSPLKRGINPFRIDSTVFPLYGPIHGQAPNDWLHVNGVWYAPDETSDGDSHMWMSEDILNWQDLGPIQGITGHDPGIVWDGEFLYLFNETGESLTFNRMQSLTRVDKGEKILDVGDHTGDADLGYFNNRWHMFFDDGAHLHYNIGYAVTRAEDFPYGWQLQNDIYGPFNPDQGQRWDDDTDKGNRFGTGDADFAVEDYTLYLFTERPVGAAYRELPELFENTGQTVLFNIESDSNADGVADDSTGWMNLELGVHHLFLPNKITGSRFRVHFKLQSDNPETAPLIREFSLFK
ncbi:MAG: hypothetical protein U5R06_00150 [candidate division KSB1 bacterium]|nr:hypothetical protein [candidate division KSB1 bacterium]